MRGGIHHIDLTVKDPAASRPFYEAVLGFLGYRCIADHPRGYDFDARVNVYLLEGKFNTMVKMYCLQPSGDQELVSKVFGGTDLGALPLYDGSDVWPVAPEILSDPQDPESSTLVFENSTIVDNEFDSGPNEEFILSIPAEIEGCAATLGRLARVRHMRLRPLAPEFAQAIFASAVIDRLRTLELIGVRGQTLEILLAYASKLRRLEHLRVAVTPAVAEQRARELAQLRSEVPTLELG